MNILVIDVGGSSVKILVTGESDPRSFDSGSTMTPEQMVAGVKELAQGWKYNAVSIGFPAVVKHDQPVTEPHNLGTGWVNFDYAAAFGCPVKMINDAAMQALGSFNEGKMLFLGLGTGLGSTMVIEGIVVPMELAHLPYRKKTFEAYVGEDALARDGKKKWRKHVIDVIARLRAALVPDDIVIGGGNIRHFKTLPAGCRAGDNANAFDGGFRMWEAPAGTNAKPAGSPAAKAAKKKPPAAARRRGSADTVNKG